VPEVAVVVPVRDRAGMVADAVASVLAQTHRDYGLVIVDDGSTDDSAAIGAAALEAAPSGSRLLRSEPRGVAAARNTGAAALDSAWIAFLDSDDVWLSRKLAVQLAWLASRPSYRIAQTGERWLDTGRHRNPRLCHRKDEQLFPRCLERCLVSPSAVIIERALYESLGGFDESFHVCEDYELWLRIALREPVGLVPEQLVVKRGGHPGQLSRSTWGLDRWRVAALAKYLVTAPLEDAQRAAVVAVLRAKCEVLAAGAARRGRLAESARYRAVADAAGVTDAAPRRSRCAR
jgi:glycosyltransferase involved in cell wall biosynthesis